MADMDGVTVTFQGAMTIAVADEARRRLLAAMGAGDRVDIDCSGVDEADTAFVQLLLAARLGGEAAGKSIRLVQPAGGALRATLERGGFVGAVASAEQRFWNAE